MDEPTGIVDASLRLVVILLLIGWNGIESLSLRTPYPSTMVALWDSPIWRILLLLSVWLGAEWCPRVGLLTGMAVSMYIINMIQIS
jgi:succinate dehydrogenase hydrophobic anchor subunit